MLMLLSLLSLLRIVGGVNHKLIFHRLFSIKNLFLFVQLYMDNTDDDIEMFPERMRELHTMIKNLMRWDLGDRSSWLG